MKLLLAAGALLLAQSAGAAELKVTELECTALNAAGYASLKLDRSNLVNIVVNSAFTSKAEIKSVGEFSVRLAQPDGPNQYRLEFQESLKPGQQRLSGSLYAKYSASGPFYLVSYASCNLNLAEVAP